MSPWGFVSVIGIAAALVAFALFRRVDTQALTAVVGFASAIVTGVFGIMTSRNLHREPRSGGELAATDEKARDSTPRLPSVK